MRLERKPSRGRIANPDCQHAFRSFSDSACCQPGRVATIFRPMAGQTPFQENHRKNHRLLARATERDREKQAIQPGMQKQIGAK